MIHLVLAQSHPLELTQQVVLKILRNIKPLTAQRISPAVMSTAVSRRRRKRPKTLRMLTPVGPAQRHCLRHTKLVGERNPPAAVATTMDHRRKAIAKELERSTSSQAA
jgi:hypothetical protein